MIQKIKKLSDYLIKPTYVTGIWTSTQRSNFYERDDVLMYSKIGSVLNLPAAGPIFESQIAPGRGPGLTTRGQLPVTVLMAQTFCDIGKALKFSFWCFEIAEFPNGIIDFGSLCLSTKLAVALSTAATRTCALLLFPFFFAGDLEETNVVT